jgi:putative transposase
VIQTCIVHLIRNSMGFASWKDRRAIAGALRSVYRAENAEAGVATLEAFEVGPWSQKYRAFAQTWRRHWNR